MRTCIFCGKDANSREDAWPRWLTERFQSPNLVEVRAERRGVALKPWRQRRPELVVRCVCSDCNNGWMSNLEGQAKPHLENMLEGSRVGLDLAAQTTITLWGMKIVMVLDRIDAPSSVYSDLECSQLRTMSVIPSRTRAWLAAAAQSTFMMSSRTEHHSGPNAGTNAFATTLVFGHVGLQFFTLRANPPVPDTTRVEVDVRRGPWKDATAQIWMPNSRSAFWPPSVALDGEDGLNLFAERFGVTTVDAMEKDVLAV